MCQHIEMDVIAQIVNKENKEKTNLYSCRRCHATYVKLDGESYRKITPRNIVEYF